jgi:gliding motility-associated-like protein
LPYNWNGRNYDAAGTYTVTLQNAAGCDSVATLVLNVNICCIVTSTTSATVCENELPYRWNGKSYSSAGDYEVHLVSSKGCDSVATLKLSVNEVSSSTTTLSICAAQLPYSWNGNTYNAAGTYNVTLTANNGCDSVAKLVLSVKNELTSTTNKSICANDLPFSWNGKDYSEAGTYSITLQSAGGCDSIATLKLSVNNPAESTSEVEICSDELPYTWNGRTLTGAGTYNVSLTTVAGCDSIVTLVLKVNASVNLVINEPEVSCTAVDLTSAAITNGSDAGLTFTYWKDQVATQSLDNPGNVTESGTYYIKASAGTSCDAIKPVIVKIVDAIEPAVSISTSSTSVCNNNAITFTATPVNGGSAPSYQWKVNGINVGINSNTFTSTTLKSGDVVTVVMTSSAQCTTTPAATSNGITLDDNIVTPSVSIIASTTAICNDEPITFTAVPVNGGAMPYYLWKLNGVDVGTNSPVYSSADLKDGDVISVVMTSSAGCTTNPVAASNEVIMTEGSASPAVSIKSEYSSNCETAVVIFTALPVNGGSNPIYQWKLNGVNVGENKNTYTSSSLRSGDVVSVQMTASITCGGDPEASASADPVQLQQAPKLVVKDPAAVCVPAAVDITLPLITQGTDPGVQLTYWMDAAAGTPISNPRQITQGGTYFIRAANDAGCGTIRPVNVELKPLPTAIISGNDTICEGSTATLKVELTGAAPWSFTYSDGVSTHTVNDIQQPTYEWKVTVNQETQFTMISVSDANCSNSQLSSTVTIVTEHPIPGMRYSDVNAFAFVPKHLTARNPGIDYTHKWNPDKGLNLPNIYDPVFNDNQSREYTIEITSPAGCVTVDTQYVRVVNGTGQDIKPDIFVPNAWTPNGDGVNDHLYPFLVNIRTVTYFRVFNRWGQLMYEVSDVPASEFPRGWDGKWKGVEQVMDAYTWTIEAIGVDGTHFKRIGQAALLR